MATMSQLETALSNAHNAGDSSAARKLAAVIGRERKRVSNDKFPDVTQALEGIEHEVPETITPRDDSETIGETLTGTGEAALSMGTAITGGLVGSMEGSAEGIVREILSGNFGSAEAADRIEELAMKRAQQLTFEPRTESGKDQVQAVGEALAPLAAIPPAQAMSLGQASRFATPQVTSAASKAGAVAGPKIKHAASEIARMARERMPSQSVAQDSNLSVGAAQTPMAMRRQLTYEGLPVPFKGDSALTKGQVTGNFEQLQFEKEAAKMGDTGAALRSRVENQTNTLIQNLDAISDLAGPVRSEVRDIGRAVDDALTKRHRGMKKREKSLYQAAEKAGEMRESVQLGDVQAVFNALDEMEGVAPNAGDIKKTAIKRGLITETGDGLISQPKTLAEVERFRQFVNDVTDITDSRQARVRAVVLSAIDESTENAGGDAYKKARKFSSGMRQEFENVGLTKKLLANKRGSSERQTAYEDVFKKVMLDSPIEEINKLRATLLKAGTEGKQAWADLKGKGIEYIKENAQSQSQRSEGGTPLLSPDKLNKVISSMDAKGKLEKIYGKKSAQAIRDLGELANVIYNAPPGAVNFSNTASALQVGLDSLGTFAVTGIPAPVATTLRAGLKYVKDKKTKARIEESLNYLRNQSQN